MASREEVTHIKCESSRDRYDSETPTTVNYVYVYVAMYIILSPLKRNTMAVSLFEVKV